ncbi:MAG: hypothetical protein V1491_00235 [archaeon]
MAQRIVCYSAKDLSPSRARKLHRTLYGFKDYSNQGSYTYQRKGIVEGKSYKKIVDGVLLVKEIDVKKILKIFRENEISPRVFKVA